MFLSNKKIGIRQIQNSRSMNWTPSSVTSVAVARNFQLDEKFISKLAKNIQNKTSIEYILLMQYQQ